VAAGDSNPEPAAAVRCDERRTEATLHGAKIISVTTAGAASRDVKTEDWRLARDGDPDAYERLYRANVGRVHALAIRMVGRGPAEDLTQEIFIRAWEKLGTFRGDARFSTWLHRLAVNHLLSRRETLRKRQRRKVDVEGAFEDRAGSHCPPGVALDLEHAIQTLPPRARQVFVLYDIEGYMHQEIAEMLNVSVGTSKSQLHRARMLLRDVLA